MVALGAGCRDMVGLLLQPTAWNPCQIPTTLLSQVDSSGGKRSQSSSGIYDRAFPNRSLFSSIHVLETLPQKEMSAGMAEVIKYGLL